MSAHYYFRDFSQADTGVVPFLVMLELVSEGGTKLSELLRPYRERFFLTGRDQHARSPDVPLKLQELKERYAAEGGRVSHLDGISIDFDDWHFNVRPSNTEPLLRLNLEALSEELMVREARRGARRHPCVRRRERPRSSVASPTGGRRSSTRRSPASGSRTPTPRVSSTTAGTSRTSTTRAPSTTAISAGSRLRGREFVMRASNVEYHAPARFDDLIEAFVRVSRIGRTSVTYECAAYRLPDDTLMVTAQQTLVLVDADYAAARRRCPTSSGRQFEHSRAAISRNEPQARRTRFGRSSPKAANADDVLRAVVAALTEPG